MEFTLKRIGRNLLKAVLYCTIIIEPYQMQRIML
jgi:hypothetical protein